MEGWAWGRRVGARLRVRPAGVVGAVVLVCLSLTPSLLPRTWMVQGVISGLCGAVGYGLGVVIGTTVRRIVRWRPPPRARLALWGSVAGVAGLALGLSLYGGSRRQRELYQLVGEVPPGRLGYLRVLLVTVGIVAAAVLVARLTIGFGHLATRLAAHKVGPLPARLIGAAAVVTLGLIVVDGVLLDGSLSVATFASSAVNSRTVTAVSAPTAPERSGSPGSEVTWASLGREGRSFVAGGPTREQLRAYAGAAAMEPIRVYVGLDSAPPGRTAAELAVRELRRTGAASRAVLCVVTTTGTGWIDPYAAAALEYLLGGDTAIVGTQYSHLPSWISFLTERERAADAGRTLFDAVYGYWSTLPAGHRPRLVVFGESLGSYGSESAFADLDDLSLRVDGALWIGPTNANPLWRHVVAGREPGTPEVLPVYQDGTRVRFASRPGDLGRPGGAWVPPRVVYLQNPSDPVIWWSPRLLYTEPDWLREPRGYDVLPAMRWYPVVTFLQVTADLALAQRVRSAHGHYYRAATVAAWAAILQPPQWTDARSLELTALLDRVVPIR